MVKPTVTIDNETFTLIRQSIDDDESEVYIGENSSGETWWLENITPLSQERPLASCLDSALVRG